MCCNRIRYTPRKAGRVRARRGEGGFSTIEALIAVALLSAALLPLVALQGEAARQAARLAQTEARLQTGQAALARLGTLNPMAEPEGREAIGAFELVWTARLAGPEQSPGMVPGEPSRFVIALYEVDASVYRGEEMIWSVQVRQIGWRVVGPMMPL